MTMKMRTTMVRWQMLIISAVMANGQQPYIANHQLDCYDHTYDSITKGFVCNGQHSSCTAYLTYRTQPPYTSPNTVGYLLGVETSATRITSINNVPSDMASVPTNTQLVVPVSCSCFNSSYYQHNASYTLKDHRLQPHLPGPHHLPGHDLPEPFLRRPQPLRRDGSHSSAQVMVQGVYVGVAVAAAAVLIVPLFLVLFRLCRKTGTPKIAADNTGPKHGNDTSSAEYGQGIQNVV